MSVGTADRPCRPGTARPEEVGSADRSFSGNPGKPENSGTQIYGSRIRRENRRQQLSVGTADRPCRPGTACPEEVCSADLSFPGNRKNEEFGSLNQWLPNSCSIRRQQPAVGPADRALPVSPAFFVSSLRKNHPSTPPTKTGSGWAVNGGRLPESLKGGLRRTVQKNSIVSAYDGVWWRRGGSNPCPKTQEYDVLRAQSVL